MRGLSYIVIVVLSIIVSCAPYDDTAIWDKLNEHEGRILKLEDLCLRLNEDISAQQKVLEALREKEKAVIILHYFEDLSIKDIASILQIPAGTVKYHLSIGRNHLKSILQ